MMALRENDDAREVSLGGKREFLETSYCCCYFCRRWGCRFAKTTPLQTRSCPARCVDDRPGAEGSALPVIT